MRKGADSYRNDAEARLMGEGTNAQKTPLGGVLMSGTGWRENASTAHQGALSMARICSSSGFVRLGKAGVVQHHVVPRGRQEPVAGCRSVHGVRMGNEAGHLARNLL